VFGTVFVSLVRSGEQTGKLAEVLKSLSESLKWEDELAAQTKKLDHVPGVRRRHRAARHLLPDDLPVPQMTGFIRNMGRTSRCRRAS
jgi:type IV pilus assembly protein PilC